MSEFGLEQLCDFLKIPRTEMAKFDDIEKDLDIKAIKGIFYESEDNFFGYLHQNLKDKYLEILYIYLNLAIDLYYKYQEMNIDINIYFDTIDDIRIWINNCVKEKNTYGLSEIYWINEHLRMRIFKLGRLQFQKREISEYRNIFIKNGINHLIDKDYLYFVHIPEGQKLSYDLVLDSYQKAKLFYNDKMIFACESWMLSDKLDLILNENSNMIKFRNDFHLLHQTEEENHIKRYLNKDSKLLEKVLQLEQKGVLIGEGFGICLKYID